MLILAFVALVLILIDSFTSWLQPVHRQFESGVWPFYWIANLPTRFKNWADDALLSSADLRADRERLRTELLVYQGQLQRMAELSAENLRLRNLLNATELLSDKVLVTELIGVSPDPLRHQIFINRGVNDGVFAGQPVIDSEGLMGQVVEVFKDHAQVLLITDNRHALPVKVVRNGLRAIAEGIGDYQQIRLRHISPTLDITVGDSLVSSGLGERFPEGYPVGVVVDINNNIGKDFVEVLIEPAAKVDRSRHLLLVFSEVLESNTEVPGLVSAPGQVSESGVDSYPEADLEQGQDGE